jgi:hypothetical protein
MSRLGGLAGLVEVKIKIEAGGRLVRVADAQKGAEIVVPKTVPKSITRAQEKRMRVRITSDSQKDRLVDKERRLLALPAACCR